MTDQAEFEIEEETSIASRASQPEERPVDLRDSKYYINREMSLLEFQRRVLEEAQDEKNPLLERVKFLAILSSNLDEFFMVRCSGVKKQIEAGVIDTTPDGMNPAEELAAIRKTAWQLMISGQECLRDDLLPLLAKAGIFIRDYDALTLRQKAFVDSFFEEIIFPVLTPLAFDPGHPFPHISNLSLNLAVAIRDPRRGEAGQELFARIKVPSTLPRLVPLKPSSGSLRRDGTPPHRHYFVWLEQVICANLNRLFPGMQIIDAYPFRITRDADMAIQELEADDLLETMEMSVRQRRFGSVVRVQVNDAMPTRMREILIENLELDHRDIYTLDGPLGLNDLMALHALDRPDLKDPPLRQAIPSVLRGEHNFINIFNQIRQEDILVHHPYDSFVPVVDFLKQAARDPDVLAIKQTLYRVGKNSPVVKTLLEASQNGKQVAVLVELKARFDEESNITWARMLESEGVHVIYGLPGLKTHSKVALVVRREGERIRRYVHLATGNYNAITAQIYEDIGMFTADEDIGADASDLFNFLTGYSAKRDYRKLLVAPVNLRSGIESLIEREIEHQLQGKQGHLIFKTNSLVDGDIIRLLYRASQAGVKVDLIVRGICCLRPGIPGISDNIRVISILGRFLEHSRVYYFRNNGQEQIYLGSADLMPRNINWRVEVLFPVQDMHIIRHLRDDVLETYLKANSKVRVLQPDGSYQTIKPDVDKEPLNCQSWLLKQRSRS